MFHLRFQFHFESMSKNEGKINFIHLRNLKYRGKQILEVTETKAETFIFPHVWRQKLIDPLHSSWHSYIHKKRILPASNSIPKKKNEMISNLSLNLGTKKEFCVQPIKNK